jgi:hypothetical protein
MSNDSTAWSRLIDAHEHRAKKEWLTTKNLIEDIVRYAKPSEVSKYPRFTLEDLVESKVYNLSSNYQLLKAMCIHAGLDSNNVAQHIDALKPLNQYSEPTSLRLYMDFTAKNKPLDRAIIDRHLPQLTHLDNWSKMEEFGRMYERPELMDLVFNIYVSKNLDAVKKISSLRDRYSTNGNNNLSIELARIFDQEHHSKPLENVAVAHHDLYGLAALVVQGRSTTERWLETAIECVSQYPSDRHSTNNPISNVIALIPTVLKNSPPQTDLTLLFTHVLPKIEPVLDTSNTDYLSGVQGWLSTLAPLLSNGTLTEDHPYTARVKTIASEFWNVMNNKPAYAEYLRSTNRSPNDSTQPMYAVKSLLNGGKTYQELGVLFALNSCFFQDTLKANTMYWSQFTNEELDAFKQVSITEKMPGLASEVRNTSPSRYRSSSASSSIVHNAGAILPLLHPNDVCIIAPSFIESKAINEKTLRSEWAKYDESYGKTIPRDFNTSRPAYLLYAISRQDPREALNAIQLLGDTTASARMDIYTTWLKQHLPGVVHPDALSVEGLFA